MILEFDTTLGIENQNTINLPIGNHIAFDTIDITVDWGDGTPIEDIVVTERLYREKMSKYRLGNIYHIYDKPGKYTVSIDGFFNNFGYDFSACLPNMEKLVAVKSFGNSKLLSLDDAFAGCTNLISVPKELPQSIISMKNAFNGATRFNDSNICYWNIENIQDISCMFQNAHSFNQDISGWKIKNGKIDSLIFLFYGATNFNQPLDKWDVSDIKYVDYMFSHATSFNQPIGNWNTSNFISCVEMFKSACSFNQDISGWDLSNAKDMTSMFEFASSFDRKNFSKKVNQDSIMYRLFITPGQRWEEANHIRSAYDEIFL